MKSSESEGSWDWKGLGGGRGLSREGLVSWSSASSGRGSMSSRPRALLPALPLTHGGLEPHCRVCFSGTGKLWVVAEEHLSSVAVPLPA